MAAPLIGAAAVAAGTEILQLIAKIAGSEEGLAWIGRKLHDRLPALRARIRSNKHVKVGGK